MSDSDSDAQSDSDPDYDFEKFATTIISETTKQSVGEGFPEKHHPVPLPSTPSRSNGANTPRKRKWRLKDSQLKSSSKRMNKRQANPEIEVDPKPPSNPAVPSNMAANGGAGINTEALKSKICSAQAQADDLTDLTEILELKKALWKLIVNGDKQPEASKPDADDIDILRKQNKSLRSMIKSHNLELVQTGDSSHGYGTPPNTESEWERVRGDTTESRQTENNQELVKENARLKKQISDLKGSGEDINQKFKQENRRCFNCGERGHLSRACRETRDNSLERGSDIEERSNQPTNQLCKERSQMYRESTMASTQCMSSQLSQDPVVGDCDAASMLNNPRTAPPTGQGWQAILTEGAPVNNTGLSQLGWLELQRTKNQLLKYIAEEDKGEGPDGVNRCINLHISNTIASIGHMQGQMVPGRLRDELSYYLSLASYALQRQSPDQQPDPPPAEDTATEEGICLSLEAAPLRKGSCHACGLKGHWERDTIICQGPDPTRMMDGGGIDGGRSKSPFRLQNGEAADGTPPHGKEPQGGRDGHGEHWQ
jgi:hypothetical protein